MQLSAIMTSPEFGEVCFLVAFILFVIAVVAHITRPAFEYLTVIIPAGLAFLALGWLAL